MKLILISPPENIPGEIRFLIKLFEMGLECFHLRKPDMTQELLKDYLNQVPKNYLSKVAIHSNHELANLFQIGGVHFTSSNHDLIDSCKLNARYSASTHTFEEVLELDGKLDYLWISPVYSSISKLDYKNQYSIKQFESFLKWNNLKSEIIALGGITSDKIEDLKKIGFDGVGILGDLWIDFVKNGEKSALKKFNQYKTYCK